MDREKVTDAEFVVVKPAKRVWFDWRVLAAIVALAAAAFFQTPPHP